MMNETGAGTQGYHGGAAVRLRREGCDVREGGSVGEEEGYGWREAMGEVVDMRTSG